MTTTDARIRLFVDTNALIRLHIQMAPDHISVQTALKALVIRQHELWLNRQVLHEYANVLTRPQSYVQPIPPGDVAKQLRQFETTYRIADETPAVSQELYKLMETVSLGGKQIHDANIVATMMAYQIPLLFTLNIVDFQRFNHLIRIITPQDVKL
ncbi:MAG: PIN domain-containing protein [Anaerolineales bacterium]|nr:PIN domain-containing protein [Anaerolineales bacterium]